MILIKLSLFLNQIKSLEKRLRVTEERLHQERSDRANNLSAVEDKLLTENARLQVREIHHTCVVQYLSSLQKLKSSSKFKFTSRIINY